MSGAVTSVNQAGQSLSHHVLVDKIQRCFEVIGARVRDLDTLLSADFRLDVFTQKIKGVSMTAWYPPGGPLEGVLPVGQEVPQDLKKLSCFMLLHSEDSRFYDSREQFAAVLDQHTTKSSSPSSTAFNTAMVLLERAGRHVLVLSDGELGASLSFAGLCIVDGKQESKEGSEPYYFSQALEILAKGTENL